MTQPDIDHLASLASGDLAPEEAAQVESDAERSAEASASLAIMRAAIGALRTDDSVAPPATGVQRAKAIFARLRAGQPRRTWLEGIVEAVASLIHDSRLEPAMAGFRGAGDGYRLTFEAGDREIELQVEHSAVEPAASGSPLCQVIGQVSSASSADATIVAFAAPGTREPLAEAPTDDRGVFSMALPKGRYDLLVEGATGVIVVPGLDIP